MSHNGWNGGCRRRANAPPGIRRHDVIVDWLSVDATLRELRDQDNLSLIEELFSQEPHDASRFALAKTLLVRPTFVDMLAKDSNIDLLLRVIDLPANPSGRQDLLLTFIRQARAPTIFQSETLRKILRFVETKSPATSSREIKLALLDLLASPQDVTKQLSVSTFSELCSGLTEAEFLRVPMMLHSALVEQAFMDKDWLRVDAELQRCRESNDGDAEFYASWIKRLGQAGQTDRAKDWAQKIGISLAPPQ